MAKPAGHKRGCGCVICARGRAPKKPAKTQKARNNSSSGAFRSGARVVVKANPASRLLYTGLPPNGTEGVVVALPVGNGNRAYMPGPGGGLNFVKFTTGKVMGVSPRDLAAAPRANVQPKLKPVRRNTKSYSSPCCGAKMRNTRGIYTCPCGQNYRLEA